MARGRAKVGKTLDGFEILSTFAVVTEPDRVAPELHRRFGDAVQRITFYAPYASNPARWAEVLGAIKSDDAGDTPDSRTSQPS